MPLTCKLITVIEKPQRMNGHRFTRKVDQATGKPPVPGDMFFAPWILDESEVSISPHYKAIFPSRHPIVVVLPNGHWWCVDQRAYERPPNPPDGHQSVEDWQNSGWHGDGWTVTGEPPNISAQPSINTTTYHGMLTNGVLSDDMGSHVPE